MYIKRQLFKNLILIAICTCFVMQANAQTHFLGEIGVLGGVSYYNGDANSTKIFKNNDLAFGGLIRAHITDRFMVKVNVIRGEVHGNTNDFPDVYPYHQQVSFNQRFWDVGLHFEHNMIKYGMSYWDREMKRHTPYVLIGPGLTNYRQWSGNQITFNLTFGVGYKFKICERLNFGVEWSMRKLFVDDFDVTTSKNTILNNPYKMDRSWLKNNDYYTCAFAFLSVDLLKRNGACRTVKF